MSREFTEEEIIEFLKIPLEIRVRMIDDTNKLLRATMNNDAKEAFDYLRNTTYSQSDYKPSSKNY